MPDIKILYATIIQIRILYKVICVFCDSSHVRQGLVIEVVDNSNIAVIWTEIYNPSVLRIFINLLDKKIV